MDLPGANECKTSVLPTVWRLCSSLFLCGCKAMKWFIIPQTNWRNEVTASWKAWATAGCLVVPAASATWRMGQRIMPRKNEMINSVTTENFLAFTGPKKDFGLILLILNMIIHKEFYRSNSFFISKCPRSGKFCCVC